MDRDWKEKNFKWKDVQCKIKETVTYCKTYCKVKSSLVRTDKQNHVDELASAAEKAAADNQQGALYFITNNISGRGYRTDTFEDRRHKSRQSWRLDRTNISKRC